MRTTKIRRFSILVLALASALIVGSSFYMGIHLQAYSERTRQVQQSLQMEHKLDETLSLVTDAETGSRGYVIMGQEVFLEPYYAAIASSDGIARHLQDLRRLSLENPRQQERLDRLVPLVGEKLAFMIKIIEVRRHAGFEGAKELIATDSGRQMMVHVRRSLLEMHNIEAVLLKQCSDEAFAELQNTIYAMILGFGSGISLLVLSFLVVNREVGKRKKAEEVVLSYVKQLENAMQSTLQAVAKVVESHDPYTAGHERRVGIIAADIAREMGWSEEKCQTMQLIGLVHDIGKISVPGEILTKPGKLSAIEFELVKTHAENGYQILHDVELPLPIAQIIREHHERMDGSGYPQGLKGENTLPESRILAVADVVEAMASDRPYRPSKGIEEAIHEIESHRGGLFDPDVVDAMLRLFREKDYHLPN